MGARSVLTLHVTLGLLLVPPVLLKIVRPGAWPPTTAATGRSATRGNPRQRSGTGCKEGVDGSSPSEGLCDALGEALDERERLVGDLAPAAIDRERMPAVRDPRDLGDTGVTSLLVVRRVDDCPRHRVIAFARDEQQWSAFGILAVDLRLGPRIDVGARGLEQRSAGGRDVERLVEFLRLVIA